MSPVAQRLSAALADRYRLERELGAGGMATVYLAADLKHDRQVAIKVLRPELAAVLGAERFVQEIKTTAALQHPHILPLFDSGQADGFLFYVMPYIQGETLRDKLNRETQLSVDEAVRITTEVADALDYAHRHGVIHRDIKPENILLHDGRPMVADFGIALAVSAAAGGRMTETGLSLGTPHYMSPEQATAEKEITARSDIYSLGSVLYEMLTGNPPHTGASAQQIIMKIVTEEAAPVTKVRKSVPPHVAAAAAMAIEKLPADRFDTARAFAEALTNPAFALLQPGAGAAVPPFRRSAATLTLATTTILALALAAWALARPANQPPVIRYGLALPSDQAPTNGGYALATSDGSRIVYAGLSAQPGSRQLWVKSRDRLTPTPLAGTEAATSAAISPDDAWIAVVQGGSVRKMPLAGGASVPLAEGASNVQGGVAWLDDGSILYLAGDRFQILAIPAAGGAGSVIWSSDSLLPSNMTPLPGGRALFQACRPPCAQGDLWALDTRAGTARMVVPGAVVGFYVPTRHLVYVRTDFTALAVPFDLASLRTDGTPLVVLDSVAPSGGGPYLWISSGGTLVTRRGSGGPQSQRFELVWVDRTGRVTPVDTSWTFRHTQFAANVGWALSPDGARLAIGLNTAAGDDIWLKQLPRGPVSRVTYGSGSEHRPRWLPDGRSVTFVSSTGFFRRRADGTGTDSLLWSGGIDEGLISPDGRWLLARLGAVSAAAGFRDIYGIRPGVDSAPVPVLATPFDEMAMALSPDGRWLAYQSDETGQLEVFIRPFPNASDGKAQVSSGGGTAPLWARDGRELFYLRSDMTMMAATVTGGALPTAGESRALFRLPERLADIDSRYYTPWDVGPDGRFVMARSIEAQGGAAAPLVIVENWLEELKAMASR